MQVRQAGATEQKGNIVTECECNQHSVPITESNEPKQDTAVLPNKKIPEVGGYPTI